MSKHPKTHRSRKDLPKRLADRSMQIERLETRLALSSVPVVGPLPWEIALAVASSSSSEVVVAPPGPGIPGQWPRQEPNTEPPAEENPPPPDTTPPAFDPTGLSWTHFRDAMQGDPGKPPPWPVGPDGFPNGAGFTGPMDQPPPGQNLPPLEFDRAGLSPAFGAFRGAAQFSRSLPTMAYFPALRPSDGPPRIGGLSAMSLEAITTASIPTSSLNVAVTTSALGDATRVGRDAPAATSIVSPTVAAIPVESPSDPLRLEIAAVKGKPVYRTQTAASPELDLSAELGGELGVTSDMAKLERTAYPAAPEAGAAGDVTLLDIAASDAAVQKPDPGATADVRYVVSRDQIALDHVMAQAYAFALSATGELPAIGPASGTPPASEPPTLPAPAVTPEAAAPQDDRNAARSEPRRAGFDAAAVVSMAAAQLLLTRRRKEEEKKRAEYRAD